MSLEDLINRIRNDLKQGRFANEAAIKQGIVLPILHALGWDVFDPSSVAPEYSVEGRRVDYALLCMPLTQPKVFIEAKQVGQGNGAEQQLFQYAFHVGVRMAVLTTGQEWHFYLPAEEGAINERRVYKLDLLER